MEYLGTKDLGLHQETQLPMQLQIWQIVIDAKAETITVVYDIVLIAPSGAVVKNLVTDNFIRYNKPVEEGVPENMKYDALKASPIGQGILQLLAVDIAAIQGFETLKEDLKQF